MLGRLVTIAVALCFLAVATDATQTPIPLTLGVPVTGQQIAATEIRCFQLTLDDNTVREVVFWEAGKLLLRLDPCSGRPHMKVSVYGCPSDTKTVYEFMSAKMVNDAISQGLASTIPPNWEWPGDVETLTIDITHKTYYIEISNLALSGMTPPQTQIPSSFELYTAIFDANGTDPTQPHSKEDIFPLKYMPTTVWDRSVIRDNSSDAANSFSFGGGTTASVVTIDFYPPGLPYGPASPSTILAKNYEYSFFVLEITSQIGTSTSGPFTSVVPPLCPGGDLCTSANCRSCSTDYPNCPKEFLTDCTETTLNVATLKAALNSSSTRPFDAYVKDPTQYTAWTVCGCNSTMNRVDGNLNFATLTASSRPTTPLAWFTQQSSTFTTNPANQLQLSINGLASDNNNVYLVNVVVRPTPTGTNQTETAVYQFMTLQMRTPRYETPQLNDTDYAIIIGVSCGLGACIIIFVGVAILVRHKRKQKLAQRIRMKK